MRFTQLDAWLQWLETLHPRGIDLGLERVAAVGAELDLDFGAAKVITVAGTNGKGSCVALLEGILSAAGYRVACYTSPHLLRYNERVKIAGLEASDAALCEAFAAVDQARGETSLSYFEFGTLAAFWLFARAQPDVVLLEVGLGGRLDAVNIIDADIAVISSIALDHESWLGADRDQIGREKAGIMRPGKPAVFGDSQPLPSIAEYAAEQGVPLYMRYRDFDCREDKEDWSWWACGEESELRYAGLPKPRVILANAATVLQVIQLLDMPVPLAAIHKGFASAAAPARQQSLSLSGVEVLLDVAHNSASVACLRDYLAAHPVAGKTVALFAVMADKAVDDMLALLDGAIDRWMLPVLHDNPRAAAPESVQENLVQRQYPVASVGESVAESLGSGLMSLEEGDRLLVFGSFFTVAEAMETINTRYPDALANSGNRNSEL